MAVCSNTLLLFEEAKKELSIGVDIELILEPLIAQGIEWLDLGQCSPIDNGIKILCYCKVAILVRESSLENSVCHRGMVSQFEASSLDVQLPLQSSSGKVLEQSRNRLQR